VETFRPFAFLRDLLKYQCQFARVILAVRRLPRRHHLVQHDPGASDAGDAAGLVFFVFDLLHLDGDDVGVRPLWPAGCSSRCSTATCRPAPSNSMSRSEFLVINVGLRDAMGRVARNGNFVAATNRWSASDAPAERLEQVPRRPGPK
jgi:hypothetical protein